MAHAVATSWPGLPENSCTHTRTRMYARTCAHAYTRHKAPTRTHAHTHARAQTGHGHLGECFHSGHCAVNGGRGHRDGGRGGGEREGVPAGWGTRERMENQIGQGRGSEETDEVIAVEPQVPSRQCRCAGVNGKTGGSGPMSSLCSAHLRVVGLGGQGAVAARYSDLHGGEGRGGGGGVPDERREDCGVARDCGS